MNHLRQRKNISFISVLVMASSFVCLSPPVMIHAEDIYDTLEQIEQIKSAESLLPFLTNSDERICSAAAVALGKLGDRQAVNPLLGLLEKGPFDVYNDCISSTVDALGRLKDPRAFEVLLAKFSTGNCRTCAHALIEIIRVAPEPRLILPAIKADDKAVRLAAAQALDRLGWRPATVNAEIDYLIAKQDWEEAAKKGVEAIAPMASLLKSFSWIEDNDDAAIVAALGKISDPRVVEILRDYLFHIKDGRYGLSGRIAAVNALGAIQGDSANEALILGLKASEHGVKMAAIEMLSQRKATQTVPLIVSALTDDDDFVVREVAARGLDALGWEPANSKEKAAYYIVRKDVEKCAALGVEAVEPILNLAYDLGFAKAVLIKIGAPAVEPLIAVMEKKRTAFGQYYSYSTSPEKAAVEILAEINDPRAIEPLIRAVQGADLWLRQSAAEALGKIKSPQAVIALTTLLKDDLPDNRKSAAEALKKMAWSPSTDEEKLYYYVSIEDMAECEKIGAPAMNLLLDSIRNNPYGFLPLIEQMESARSIELLKRCLTYYPPTNMGLEDAFRIRQKAAEALARIGWIPSTDEEKTIYYIASQNWDQCEKLGAKVVENLIVLLNPENGDSIFYPAIEALGNIKDPRAIKPLIYVLSMYDHTRAWRFNIERPKKALRGFGLTAVDPLIDAFKNPLITVDPNAFFQLKVDQLKYKAGNSSFELSNSERERIIADCLNLIKKLTGNNWAIRISAGEVLLTVNWREEKDKMAKELGDDYPDFVRLVENQSFIADRKEMAPILAEIGDKRAIPALVENLQDLEAYDAIAEALHKLGWQPQTERERVYYMINTKDKRCLSEEWETVKEILLEDVRSDNMRLVYYALSAFVAMGKEEVVPQLIEILNRNNTAMLAEAFVERGFEKLNKEGNKWLARHGYRWVALVGGRDNSPAAWTPW